MPPVETLNLLFPQWQGSGSFGLQKGAKQLHGLLKNKETFVEIPINSAYTLELDRDILGLSQISSQLASACDTIRRRNPDRIFTIGGDCGVEIAPVSFLNQKHDDMAVIWLDAHGDLNTPNSSPSKHFHGMPLRSLLGEGSSNITEQTFSTLKPTQIFLVGAREFDRPERAFIQQNQLSIFSANSVNNNQSGQLFSAIETAGFNKIYIHLDLDVIDPVDFPHVACPTPGGIQIDCLKSLLSDLTERFDSVGSSVLEFLPTDLDSEAIAQVSQLIDIIQ